MLKYLHILNTDNSKKEITTSIRLPLNVHSRASASTSSSFCKQPREAELQETVGNKKPIDKIEKPLKVVREP